DSRVGSGRLGCPLRLLRDVSFQTVGFAFCRCSHPFQNSPGELDNFRRWRSTVAITDSRPFLPGALFGVELSGSRNRKVRVAVRDSPVAPPWAQCQADRPCNFSRAGKPVSRQNRTTRSLRLSDIETLRLCRRREG